MAQRRRRIAKGKTVGPSPKVVAAVVASVASWLAARYGLELSDEDAYAISAVLSALAAVLAPPGTVESRR